MAVSAFKSSSRRSNPTNSSTPFITKQNTDKDNSPNKAPLRRSRSVSAFSRSSLDSSSESFLNKRDNPLFWATESQTVEPQNPLKPTKDSKPTTPAAADTRRGRSASRISDVLGTRKDVGRSLSRVDTGRRNRSVSRCPDSRRHSVISKSEEEQEFGSLKKGGTDGKNVGLVRSSSDALDQLKGLRTWSSQHSSIQSSNGSDANLSCLQSLNWEDGVSTASSLSGAEEKTIKAVCEQMNMNRAHSCDNLSVQGNHLEDDTSTTSSSIYKTVRTEVRRAIYEIQNDLERAMQRSNTPTLASTDITDIPPDLVNPSAVELVLDIRREYAKKLEQSQERARKLRSDLAVEEHREQELSRILKEVLPDPKTSNAPKSRPGRKASIERRKMSKCLTEEAMAYFDECVSLSTFDSSDFSSPEDPPLNLIGITTPVSKSASLLQANSSASVTSSSNRCLNDKQELSIKNQFTSDGDAPGLMASSGPREPALNKSSPKSANIAQDCKFSFAHKPTETPELQQDIRKYIRNFEKGIGKDELDLRVVRSKCYDIGEYNLQDAAQSYMFDRVIFRNRIESGGILLCGGGISSSFSPFASFV